VPFTEYETNETAKHAAEELDSAKFKSTYAGPLDSNGHVTPRVLFRGGFNAGATTGPMPASNRSQYFAGELTGPYLSQFCFRPTSFGVQELDQKLYNAPAGLDFMIDETTWELIQAGKPTGIAFPLDKTNRALVQTAKAGHIPRELTFCGSELGCWAWMIFSRAVNSTGRSLSSACAGI